MLRCDEGGGVVVLTIDRPERRNALDRATVSELGRQLSERAEAAVPIVVTGAGSVFSSGFDLSTRDEGEAFKVEADAMFASLLAYPAPVFAAMNGPAIGMGAVLAATCDLRLAHSTAWLEIPAAKLGVVLDAAYVGRVRARLGIAAAQLLFVACRRIDAARAVELGAIHVLVDDPLAEATAWAADVAVFSAASVAAHKAFVNGPVSP
jgi:enoyl-CoA hydratase